jgi:hypothetical protein
VLGSSNVPEDNESNVVASAALSQVSAHKKALVVVVMTELSVKSCATVSATEVGLAENRNGPVVHTVVAATQSILRVMMKPSPAATLSRLDEASTRKSPFCATPPAVDVPVVLDCFADEPQPIATARATPKIAIVIHKVVRVILVFMISS